MRTAENPGVRHIRPRSYARLTQDILELGLHRGEVGVVSGLVRGWTEAYEVEFHRPGCVAPLRALLLADQLEPETRPVPAESDVARFRS